MVILIELILLYIELKYVERPLDFNLKREFVIGILAGTTILLKQTLGLVFVIVFVFYKLVFITNKDELKKFFKIAISRFVTTLIPILIFAIYLSYNDIWSDFLDYAVFGIKTFTNKISYLALFKEDDIFINLFAAIVPLQIIFMIILFLSSYKNKKLDDKIWFKNMILLLVYSVSSLAVIVPISDKNHFVAGFLITFISFVYLVYIFIKNRLIKGKKIIKVIIKMLLCTLIIILMCNSIYLLITDFLQNGDTNHDLKHFDNIIINKSLSKGIKDIDEFILEEEKKGKVVYILDKSSAVYTVPIDRYYKDYDMFNMGNFGCKGEDGIIKDIASKQENLTLLILQKEDRDNWQFPQKVIDYVESNFNKVGKVRVFDVYEK